MCYKILSNMTWVPWRTGLLSYSFNWMRSGTYTMQLALFPGSPPSLACERGYHAATTTSYPHTQALSSLRLFLPPSLPPGPSRPVRSVMSYTLAPLLFGRWSIPWSQNCRSQVTPSPQPMQRPVGTLDEHCTTIKHS